MHKEIFECPETVENAGRGRLIVEEGLAKLGGIESIAEKLRRAERITIVACGTAAHAGMIGEYMIEEYAGIPVEVDIGSEFRYRNPVFAENTVLVAISQSGETADTLAAVREAKRKGVQTLGIVNVVGSTIARETGVGVYSHAGPEMSVASTKAFISQLTILALLTIFLGRGRRLSITQGKEIARELERVPDLLRSVLGQENRVREIAEKHRNAEQFVFLGRKYSYPLALEGALKLKEISYVPAQGYAAGEFKHGPIALIHPHLPSFFIAPKDSVYEKTKSNLEEVRARGGPIIALTTEGNAELEAFTDDVIFVPKTLELLTPILAAIPLYLFAYHMAVLRENDVDKPRNLAKSVTVE
jgi:glucosamine--fructose-6-phosphate aminotransferase (isomerizing)